MFVALVGAIIGFVVLRRARGQKRTARLAKHFEASAEFSEIYEQMHNRGPNSADSPSRPIIEHDPDGTQTVKVSSPARTRAEVLAEL